MRHLKGEDDKPLPPSKPRKQYKMAKETRGDDGAAERPKKAKEEKREDQVSSEPCWGHQLALGLPVPCPSQLPHLLVWCCRRAPCPEHPQCGLRAEPVGGSRASVLVVQVAPYLRALKRGHMWGLNSSLHPIHQAPCPNTRLYTLRGRDTF